MCSMMAPRLSWIVALVAILTACQNQAPSQSQAPSPRGFVPVVYFQRAPIAGWQAVDWSGHPQEAIGSDSVGNPYQSPDGSRLAWSPNGDWQIVDHQGNVV